jgi:hypothetical protein
MLNEPPKAIADAGPASSHDNRRKCRECDKSDSGSVVRQFPGAIRRFDHEAGDRLPTIAAPLSPPGLIAHALVRP